MTQEYSLTPSLSPRGERGEGRGEDEEVIS